MNIETLLSYDSFEINDGIKYCKIPFNALTEALFVIGFENDDDPREDLIIPSEVYGEKVVGILPDAFKGNKRLKTVKLSEDILYISSKAFMGCQSLKSIDLGKSVAVIGGFAFCNCVSLESINFPDSLELINEFAFANCHLLLTLEFPDNLSEIGECAFIRCTTLTNVKHKETNHPLKIGKGAFSRCTLLESVSLPASILSGYVFSYCPRLTSAHIGSFSIDAEATFLADSQLMFVIIDKFLRTRTPSYFYGCKSLAKIINIDPIDEKFFISYSKTRECKSFGYRIDKDNNAEILYYNGTASDVKVPNILGKAKVTTINDGAFFGDLNIKTISFNIDLENIRSDAFFDCDFLSTVSFNDKLCAIGEYAFAENDKITKLNIPYNVQYIGKFAFGHCYNLSEAEFIGGPVALPTGLFHEDENLKKVKLGHELISIDLSCFDFCESLKDLTIPASVENIVGELRAPVKKLKVNPKNKIYDSRANSNTIIESMTSTIVVGCQGSTIPSTVTGIADGAFTNVFGLDYLYIPSNVDYVEGTCFSNDQNLKVVLAEDSPLSLADFKDSLCEVSFEEIDAEA